MLGANGVAAAAETILSGRLILDLMGIGDVLGPPPQQFLNHKRPVGVNRRAQLLEVA